jgi:hypothetical protein
MLPNLSAPHVSLSTPALSFTCIQQIIIIIIIINVNYYDGSKSRKLTTAVTTNCYDPEPVQLPTILTT